jgi:hypothetical protein
VARTLEDSGARPAPSAGPIAAATGAASAAPHLPVPGGEPLSGLFTVEALRARWPDVVTAARAEKPVLASILEDTEPAALGGGALVLRVIGKSAMTAEGLGRSRARLEELLSRLLGGTVRVGTESAVATPERPAAADRPAAPERVTADGARAERTRALRAKHPALDQAVDALDLELLE